MTGGRDRGTIIRRGNGYSVVLDLGRALDGRRVRRWHSGYRTREDAERARVELLGQLEPLRVDRLEIARQRYLAGLQVRAAAQQGRCQLIADGRQCNVEAGRKLAGQFLCGYHYERLYDDAVELETLRLQTYGTTLGYRGPIGEEDGVVYYAEAAGGLIKIGCTVDAKRREQELQMTVLATERGYRQMEWHRHQQFAEERIQGELFRPSRRLMGWIRQLATPPGETLDHTRVV